MFHLRGLRSISSSTLSDEIVSAGISVRKLVSNLQNVLGRKIADYQQADFFRKGCYLVDCNEKDKYAG